MSTAKKSMPAGAAVSRYDAADYLQTPEARAAYLQVIFDDYGDDARVVAKALGDVARAEGMQKIARETGLNREGLYQALSGTGNPSFDTILRVMRAVGVELKPAPLPTMAEIVKPKGQVKRKKTALKLGKRVAGPDPRRARAM